MSTTLSAHGLPLSSDPRYVFGYQNPELAKAMHNLHVGANPGVRTFRASSFDLGLTPSFELAGGSGLAEPLVQLAHRLGLRVRIVIDNEKEADAGVIVVDVLDSGEQP